VVENASSASCIGGQCIYTCNAGYEQSNNACVSTSFVTEWEQISYYLYFPIQGRDGTIVIDWGDGKTDTISSGNAAFIEHYYNDTNRARRITVKGTIKQWSCNAKYDDNCTADYCYICSYGQLRRIHSYGKVRFGQYAFYKADKLVSLPANESPKFYSNEMVGVFYGATKFNQSINHWDTSKVSTMEKMFFGASSFNQPLDKWNTSNVRIMDSMFKDATAFNGSLDNWNTSKVTSMNDMFSGAASFNRPVNHFDTSNVNSMVCVFQNASKFNQPLNNWNVSNVTTMAYMFKDASSFNSSLATWKTSKLANMQSMFNGATAFNQPVEHFDTSNVVGITGMMHVFRNAENFNQPLNSWNTSNVTDMEGMFTNASSFNQPLDNWDTSKVTYMNEMFKSALMFNQSLDNWNISSIPSDAYYIKDIFLDSGLEEDNYCKLFKGKSKEIWTKYKSVLGVSSLYECN